MNGILYIYQCQADKSETNVFQILKKNYICPYMMVGFGNKVQGLDRGISLKNEPEVSSMLLNIYAIVWYYLIFVAYDGSSMPTTTPKNLHKGPLRFQVPSYAVV